MILEDLKDYARIILNPMFWLMNYPYNKRWDDIVNKALDTGNIEYINDYQSNINGIAIWTENYPYAYGRPYKATFRDSVMPGRKTVLRLRKAIGKPKEQAFDDKFKEWVNER